MRLSWPLVLSHLLGIVVSCTKRVVRASVQCANTESRSTHCQLRNGAE